MKQIDLSYSDFKTYVTNKGLLIQYTQNSSGYFLFAIESNVISWQTNLVAGSADTTDFETNYKSSSNKPLEVKAGPGRPQRVAASPQPINTVQHWKGYKLTLPSGETSAYIDISFSSLVYLKGGIIVPDTHADGTCTLSLDVLYGANNMVIVPGILDGCYVVSTQPINFVSPEAMAVAPELKLRLTMIADPAPSEDRSVYITAEYFK